MGNKNRSISNEYRKIKNNNKNIKTNFDNSTSVKKKTYLERYKEALATLMGNDNSIYNDESEMLYSKRIIKKNKNNKPIKKKIFKSKINHSRKDRSVIKDKNKIKKKVYSSCDEIHKNK